LFGACCHWCRYTELAFRTLEQGRRPLLKCAFAPATEVAGVYIDGMGRTVPDDDWGMSPVAKDDALASRLWDVSQRVAGGN
jgi:hypothetical protein